MQTDGYAEYNEVCKQNNLIHLGCWDHARRKFREDKDGQPKEMKGKVTNADAGAKCQCYPLQSN